MSRRRELRFVACAALTIGAACANKKASSGSAEASASGEGGAAVMMADAHAVVTPTVAAADAAADSDAPRSPWAFDCNAGEPRAGKSVGHTSVVFKVELTSGTKAAYKPHAKKVKDRYRGEIAAYRFAEALGIPNVPPACFRTFDVAALSRVLTEEGGRLVADEVIADPQHRSKGALIPWIDGLTFWPLEKEPLRTEVRGWLTAGKAIPEANVDLARQASTLVAFDYMTGNWDRYSGENVGMNNTGIVLFIDNDAAFMEAPPQARVGRNKSILEATDRFSRGFIARVRTLDEERIAAALGEESPGKPIVSRAVVSLVARRAKELVTVVDAKIASHGEAETLYFR